MLLHSGESSEASSPLQPHQREIPVALPSVPRLCQLRETGQALPQCRNGGHPTPSLPQHPTAAEDEEGSEEG